jgi:hypothetical protein
VEELKYPGIEGHSLFSPRRVGVRSQIFNGIMECWKNGTLGDEKGIIV